MATHDTASTVPTVRISHRAWMNGYDTAVAAATANDAPRSSRRLPLSASRPPRGLSSSSGTANRVTDNPMITVPWPRLVR